MKQLIFIIAVFFSIINIYAQEKSPKEKAMDEFKNENYPKAIELLKTALKDNPNDVEIYYYLGYFTHYNAYDSRPLTGYDINYSDTVFYYLNKALELDPNYGNATYFFVAECGAGAFHALQNKDYAAVTNFYQKAKDKGGFPDWAIEYGKLCLSQVEKDAIFFTHGDLMLNICWYLQLCEYYRTDITIIPLALLNRPWFAIEMKNGGLFKNIELNISVNQLMDMHPYKWDTTAISLPISDSMIEYYNLPNKYNMEWVIKPDLQSYRTFLSTQRGLLLSIIETNNWKRSIYFAKGFDEFWTAGLNAYFQNFGLVDKLLPFKTAETEWELYIKELENFVFNESLSYYKSILFTNQPRVSGLLFAVYGNAYLSLANYYKKSNQIEKVDNIISNFEKKVKIGIQDEYENYYLEKLKEIKK